MPNEQNLISNSERTPKERQEIARAGGIASGMSRRRKRSLKDAADLFLSLPVADRRRWNKIARGGVDPEDIDNQMAIIVGLATNAAKGDAKAAKLLFDLLGEDARSEGRASALEDFIHATDPQDKDLEALYDDDDAE